MMIGWVRNVAPALLMTLASAPAQADIITVAGGGAVVSFGAAGGTPNLGPGPAATYIVTFDTGDAELTFIDASTSIYVLNPILFIADIGPHRLRVDPARFGWAVLIMSTGFRFFDGAQSDAVLNQTLQFIGTGGPTVPFLFSPPMTRDVLAFTSTFRYGHSVPPRDIAAFRNPAEQAAGSFIYRVDTGSSVPPRGFASGFSNGLILDRISGGVPEPTTWAMMILGFGLIGGALRRRRAAHNRGPLAQSHGIRRAIA